ncbi:MAG: DUF4381 family protein [Burkholderiales bacterium]
MNREATLLSHLRDLHLPAEPAAWPPAPGWWIAALLILALAALALWRGRPLWRRLRSRRRLLAALKAGAGAAEISQVLRLAAIERFPEAGAAGLHGERWLAFLESRDRAPGRFAPLATALTEMPYRAPRGSDDAEPLRKAARRWLRRVLR